MSRNNFKFGKSSERRLVGVHPRLVAVVRLALEKTSQDFTVFEGVRDVETQREYVQRGVSQTMNSKHIVQSDGYGHAVDNVPWIRSAPRWEMIPCCNIAYAMRAAAEELGTRVRWGGCWRVLNGTTDSPMSMVEEYTARKLSEGKSAFVDGPHFELYGA